MAELKVRATLDGSQFHGGIGKMLGLTSGLKSKLAGAFTIGAIGAGISKVMSYADSIEEMSQRVGISTKALQEWSFAAKQNGTDAEKLITFIERLSNAAQDMKNIKAFNAIGINPEGMTPESLFSAVQGRTAGRGSTEIQGMLQGIGLSVKHIGPMMNMLQADLTAASESARKFGAVIDDATIRSLAALNDQLSIIGQVLMGQFAPALIAAGKVALIAFSKTKGSSSWWGSMTANVSPKDIWHLATAPYRTEEDRKKTLEKIKPDKVMVATADNLFDLEERKLKEMLDSIMNYKPSSLPIITPGADGSMPTVRSKSANDSLVSVGNFLGAGRGSMESIQRQQLKAQMRIVDATENYYNLVRTWDTKTRIIIP